MKTEDLKRAMNDAIEAVARRASKAEAKGQTAKANRLYHSAKALRVEYARRFPAPTPKSWEPREVKYPVVNDFWIGLEGGRIRYLTKPEWDRHCNVNERLKSLGQPYDVGALARKDDAEKAFKERKPIGYAQRLPNIVILTDLERATLWRAVDEAMRKLPNSVENLRVLASLKGALEK